MKKRSWAILSVIIAVFMVLFIGASGFIGLQVFSASTQLTRNEETRAIPDDFRSKYNFNYKEFCNTYKIEALEILSSFEEHTIPADYIYATESHNRKEHQTVILVHGLGDNRYSNYPIAEFFLKRGYNVVTYDQRGSNENTAEYTTFGYWEKYDLIDWVNYVEEQAPGQKIGLWGASFGGATAGLAMNYENMDEKIDFLILDCPVSSMGWMIKQEMNNMDIGIPVSYMTWCGNMVNKFKLDFSYQDADVANAIKNVNTPVLIINSLQDSVTPYFMGKEIFDAIQGDNKELWTVEDSEHCEIWLDYNQEYRNKVERFISYAPTENVTLEYSDDSGNYTESYIKQTADDLVTLFTEDNQEIISGENIIVLPYVYAVKTNGQYNLLDKKTQAKTSNISYDEIFCEKFPDGRLSTKIMKGRVGKYWGLISPEGESLTDPKTQAFEDIQINTYEEVWPIIAVIEKGKYGAIDYKGKLVIKAEWDYLAMDVYNVPNTLFVFDGSKWGGIKLNNNLQTSATDYNLQPPQWIVDHYYQVLFSQTSASPTQIVDMYDFAIKYRFDFVPYFAEGNAPQRSSEYLYYAFVINGDQWGEDKGIMTKAYVENVINTHFELESILHKALRKGWDYDGVNYTAHPTGIKGKPFYVLTDLKESTKNGKTIYQAEMYECSLADRSLESDEDIVRVRTELMNGNYSSLIPRQQKETFTYYLNDQGEPVFMSHIRKDRTTMKWFFQMFENDSAFKVLGSPTGDFTDDQMATYAILKMDDYSYQKGNTKEEYNVITQKYLGRDIQNFNNGMTEIIPGTDKIRGTGWSYDSSMWVIAKETWGNDDGSTTGDFYCVNIPDSHWKGIEGAFDQAKNDLFNGDISSFSDCKISIKRVTFYVYAENSKQYFQYRSVQNLEENVDSIILYSH